MSQKDCHYLLAEGVGELACLAKKLESHILHLAVALLGKDKHVFIFVLIHCFSRLRL